MKRPLVFAAGILLLVVPPCYAYVDPGTGSYLFQILVASILAAGLSIRVFWQKIVALFGGSKRDGGATNDPGAHDLHG